MPQAIKSSTPNNPDPKDAQNALLTVPIGYLDTLPSNDIAITELLTTKLPFISKITSNSQSMSWFSTLPPTTETPTLQSIPPKPFVKALVQDFEKQHIAMSINLPNDVRLPLWVLTLWEKLHDIYEAKGRWQKSVYWLSNLQKAKYAFNAEVVKMADEVQEMLASFPWNDATGLSSGPQSTLVYSLLLSDEWVNDLIIDAMMLALDTRLISTSHQTRGLVFRNLSFSWALEKAYTRSDYGSVVLKGVANLVKECERTDLYFPVNVNRNHWIAVHIDFKKRTISYGDSLSSSEPTTLLNQLDQWIEYAFQDNFRHCSKGLAIGKQQDTISCGMCAVNAIAHAVYGDKLWSHRDRALHRLAWFQEVFKLYQLQKQGIPLALSAGWSSGYAEYCEEDDVVVLDQDDTSTVIVLPPSNLSNPKSNADVNETPNGEASPHELEMEVERLDPAHDLQDIFQKLSEPSDASDHSSYHYESDSTTGSGLESVPLEHSSPPVQRPVTPTFPKSTLSAANAKSSQPTFSKHQLSTPTQSPSHKRLKSQSRMRAESDDEDGTPKYRAKNSRKGAAEGQSSSAIYARVQNEKYRNGTFKIDPNRQKSWQQGALKVDPNAAFRSDDVKYIRHFKCGEWIPVDRPYDLTKFRKHHLACKGQGKGGGSEPLGSFWGRKEKKISQEKPEPNEKNDLQLEEICWGITADVEPRVEQYLARTGAIKGGGRSPVVIAQEMYGKTYADLTSKKHQKVDAEQLRSCQWENDRFTARVRAVQCMKNGLPPKMKRSGLCEECDKILRSKAFKTALAKDIPEEECYKYINKKYTNQDLAAVYLKSHGAYELFNQKNEAATTLNRFVKLALDNRFKAKPVFLDLLKAMTIQADKERRGVGLQNMKYPPLFDDFCKLTNLISPATYKEIRKHFTGRSPRSIQHHAAKEARFPIRWGDTAIFTRAINYVHALHYQGPLGLGVDDTKLLASLRVYLDKATDQWLLVGGIGDPIPVADDKEMRKIIQEGKVRKATKLRIWALQIPLPKIPPLVLAAKPIGDSNGHDELHDMTRWLLDGLYDANLHVVSVASDGTEVERKSQDLLVNRADSHRLYTIPHPLHSPSLNPIQIRIPILRGYHFMTVQDSNHCRKTARNNLFSGARFLVMGDYYASYELLHRIAEEEESPIFSSDVNKGDKQDDAAAIRLMNADTLAHLAKNHPEAVAHITYLFVWAELVDAIQNHQIMHLERIGMVLRTYYFFEIWVLFLERAGYPPSRYFISREAYDIMKKVVFGLIGLIIIHRDHISNEGHPAPFVPWLHSTEMCEHIFGEIRKNVVDFTYLNAIYCIPKLSIIMRSILLSPEVDGKVRSSGYLHTWYDTRDIDLNALSTYPRDEEIQTINRLAFGEAETLFVHLGVWPTTLIARPSLPAIHTLFETAEKGIQEGSNEVNKKRRFEEMCMDLGLDLPESDLSDDEHEDSEESLDKMIYQAEKMDLKNKDLRSRMDNMVITAIVSIADEATRLQNLPEDGEEELHQDSQTIVEAIEACTVARSSLIGREAIPTLDRYRISGRADYQPLIDMRRRHQTIQAATGSKTFTAPKPSEHFSERVRLMRGFAQVIREQGEHGIGTGSVRKLRWQSNGKSDAQDAQQIPEIRTGNAANAEQATKVLATQKMRKRMAAFSKKNLPLLNHLGDGGVNGIRPLRPNDYGIVWRGEQLLIAKVIFIYSRSNGKHGGHGWIPDCDSIGKVSYLSVQLFEQWFQESFRIVPEENLVLNVKDYCHLPGQYWLCRLAGKAAIGKLGPSDALLIDNQSLTQFSTLQEAKNSIKAAYKIINSRNDEV